MTTLTYVVVHVLGRSYNIYFLLEIYCDRGTTDIYVVVHVLGSILFLVFANLVSTRLNIKLSTKLLETLFGCVLARILSYTTPDACQHALGFAWCICVTARIQSLAQDLGIFRNNLRMFIELDLPLSLPPNLALSLPHNRLEICFCIFGV